MKESRELKKKQNGTPIVDIKVEFDARWASKNAFLWQKIETDVIFQA